MLFSYLCVNLLFSSTNEYTFGAPGNIYCNRMIHVEFKINYSVCVHGNANNTCQPVPFCCLNLIYVLVEVSRNRIQTGNTCQLKKVFVGLGILMGFVDN